MEDNSRKKIGQNWHGAKWKTGFCCVLDVKQNSERRLKEALVKAWKGQGQRKRREEKNRPKRRKGGEGLFRNVARWGGAGKVWLCCAEKD